MQVHRCGLFPQANIKDFNADRKGHGEIDITFRDFTMETLGHEHNADEDKKAEREHFEGRMAVDEVADIAGEKEHETDGDNDSGDHDGDFVDHADGSND